MADEHLILDLATGQASRVPLTAAEIAERDARRATADVADNARVARVLDAADALDQLIAQAGGPAAVRAKLKAVAAGTDSLSNAQVQRLVAALALVLIRDRADT